MAKPSRSKQAVRAKASNGGAVVNEVAGGKRPANFSLKLKPALIAGIPKGVRVFEIQNEGFPFKYRIETWEGNIFKESRMVYTAEQAKRLLGLK